jgi:hypothetical protein
MNTPQAPPQLPPRQQGLSKYFDLPNWVLAITILAGLVTFIAFTPNAPISSKAIVIGLTLLYLAWAFFVYDWCEQRNTFDAKLIYFGVALGLVLLIFYFARIGVASGSSSFRWPAKAANKAGAGRS